LFLVALSALATAHISAQAAPSKAPSPSPDKPVVVNLNTATATELEQLPGVGPRVSARILEYRQKKGPFKKIEELMNVQGIGEKTFLKLKPQLTVGSAANGSQPE
jgi:competence protein ComEA